ncbi:TPA: hypothetical protein HA351_08235 [Methanosarcinaceae archaeon]|nr:hypothetical protein [Methanosarcinaceae archaeon]
MSIVLLATIPLASADMQVDLLANQTLDVGMVNVTCDGNNLSIKYITEDGWTLNETHLAVAGNITGIPTTKKGNPTPGQFDYSERYSPGVIEYTYIVPIADLNLEEGDTTVIIAAHAAVQQEEGYEGITLLEEGAWGEGYRFVPKGDWAMYFEYDITA